MFYGKLLTMLSAVSLISGNDPPLPGGEGTPAPLPDGFGDGVGGEGGGTPPPMWITRVPDESDRTGPTAEMIVVTDIPQSDIENALFLEVGEYSTISFSYFNDRFLNWHKPKSDYLCYDDYTRCLLSLTVKHPICAMHKPNYRLDGFRTLSNVCDMYFYNCRRGFRFFYVMKYGSCAYYDINGYLHYHKQG